MVTKTAAPHLKPMSEKRNQSLNSLIHNTFYFPVDLCLFVCLFFCWFVCESVFFPLARFFVCVFIYIDFCNGLAFQSNQFANTTTIYDHLKWLRVRLAACSAVYIITVIATFLFRLASFFVAINAVVSAAAVADAVFIYDGISSIHPYNNKMRLLWGWCPIFYYITIHSIPMKFYKH